MSYPAESCLILSERGRFMSIDKFIMRGMTGSLGSGGDGWVAKSSPASQATQSVQSNRSGGTSFVMGGNGSGRSAGKSSSGRDHGGEPGYRSFDTKSIQESGTVSKDRSHSGSFQTRSFSEALSTSKGQRFLTAVIIYGIVIFGIIFVLSSLFGDGKSEDFYTAPPSLSPNARPLWAR